MGRRRHILPLAALLGAAGLAAGVATGEAKRPSCTPGSVHGLRTPTLALAAVVRRTLRVYSRPGGRRVSAFGRRNVNGVPTVLGVLSARVARNCEPTWYRVQLPLKPNGRTGWIRSGAVEVEAVRTRIHVDLSERRVTLYRGGRLLLRTRAAVGSRATPTPTGRYYVNQRLVPSDPSGPFGPGAVGISAFSEVLTGWVQGGPIAIHGTNSPSSIGRAVSNGCIRVPNPVLRRIFRLAVEGTPVEVAP